MLFDKFVIFEIFNNIFNMFLTSVKMETLCCAFSNQELQYTIQRLVKKKKSLMYTA